MLARASGMSHFHANDWSWSSRSRGHVQRIQMKTKHRISVLPSRMKGPAP